MKGLVLDYRHFSPFYYIRLIGPVINDWKMENISSHFLSFLAFIPPGHLAGNRSARWLYVMRVITWVDSIKLYLSLLFLKFKFIYFIFLWKWKCNIYSRPSWVAIRSIYHQIHHYKHCVWVQKSLPPLCKDPSSRMN
jgi:hypothetical protein